MDQQNLLIFVTMIRITQLLAQKKKVTNLNQRIPRMETAWCDFMGLVYILRTFTNNLSWSVFSPDKYLTTLGIFNEEFKNCFTWNHTPNYFSLHAVAQLFEAILYKPEGRGFDSRGVIRIFHWFNPFVRTMALGSTLSLT